MLSFYMDQTKIKAERRDFSLLDVILDLFLVSSDIEIDVPNARIG